MSTANFAPMLDDLPLVCGNMETFEDRHAYSENFDDMDARLAFDRDQECDFYDAEALADYYSDELTFHVVSVIPGTDHGFQFYVEEKYARQFDLHPDGEYPITNADANRVFGMPRCRVFDKAAKEKRKIRAWLLDVARENGYEVLTCAGKFSNGETLYDNIA